MHKNKAADSPVFLVVDVQVDVVAAPDRAGDRGAHNAAPPGAAVVANIAALVDRARAKGIPVVWVRHQNARLRAESPGWQIVPELAPLDGEPIVDKRFGDAFADTDLGEVLERLNADRIVLCGALTENCVRSTFNGALYRGFPVTLITDAHTTVDRRPSGLDYSPANAIAVLNYQAESTTLPGLASQAVSTAEAFTG